jgi:DNA-binding LytR/AlgR family response regulator
MKRYTCVIIDDEQFVINWLTGYVNATPNLILIKTYSDALDALTEFSGQEMVDLILLDIEMPLISGLDLSLKIRHLTRKLVFITAHRHYAYEAFEAAADGYLLKPFTLSRFAATVAKLFLDPQSAAGKPAEEEFFFVKNKLEDAKLVSVRYRDIVAIESKRNDILIHTS